MKRYTIIFTGTVCTIPRWCLIDRISPSNRGFVYFNDYKLGKRVKEFYEGNPKLSIPIPDVGRGAFIYEEDNKWKVIDAYYSVPGLELEDQFIHRILLRYAEQSFITN